MTKIPPPPPILTPGVVPPPPPVPGRSIEEQVDKIASLTKKERQKDPTFQAMHSSVIDSYLAAYAVEVLRGPPEYGGNFLIGPHHIDWSDAVNKYHRILSLASRDHGKSMFLCFAYPLWMADRRAPGRLGYIISGSAKLAEEHLNKIRMEIIGGGENGGPNPKLQHLLPFKKDTAGTIVFANGSEIRARGFGTNVRGGHPFWLVGDDMGNDEWLWSPSTRKKSIDYFLSAIRPMVVPGGQLIVVGTPFSQNDLYAYLEDTGIYHVMKHPAILPNGEPLWPERYSKERLEQTKKEMGSSIRFSREYMCSPASDDAMLFPPSLFTQPDIRQPYDLGLGPDYWHRKECRLFTGVDLAMSTSAGADYMVIFTIADNSKTGERWIVDIEREKGLGYQDQVDKIVKHATKYQSDMVFVEANQFQRVISDMVARTSKVTIRPFYTTGSGRSTTRGPISKTYSANKNAFDQGVPSLRMLLENRKLRIPDFPSSKETIDEWVNEMQAFAWSNGKLQGVGAHDDLVMAFWIANKAADAGSAFQAYWEFDEVELRESGFGFGTGDPGLPDFDFTGETANADWRPKEGVLLTW